MPTVIDSLVIELGLDPSKFTVGQAQIVDSMRKLEQSAETSARNLRDRPGRAMQEYFGRFDEHLQNVNLQLFRMGDQSRRTGEAVAGGAAEGAAGLLNLARAGTAAFGALKAVESIIHQVGAASERGAALGRAAWATSYPGGVRGLDTFIQAVQETTHTPQETTINTINQLTQRIEAQKQLGQWSEEFTRLGQLGVDFRQPFPVILNQLSNALRGRQGTEVQFWANQAGFGPLLQYLRLSPEARRQAEERARGHTIDEGVSGELTRLQTATQRFENSITHLWEILTARFGKGGFSDALEGWSLFIDQITKADSAFDHFLTTLAKEWPKNILRLLPGLAPLVSAGEAMSNLQPVPNDTRTFWQKVAPTWLGGKPPPVGAQQSSFTPSSGPLGGRMIAGHEYGSQGPGAIPAAPPAGADPAMWAAFRFISQSEGATDNPWNDKHRLNPSYYNASGYVQMLRRNWQKYADPADAARYSDAVEAPVEAQFRAFSRMVQTEHGFGGWLTGAGGSVDARRLAQLQQIMAGSHTPQTTTAPVSPRQAGNVGASKLWDMVFGSTASASEPGSGDGYRNPQHRDDQINTPLNRGYSLPPGTHFNSRGQPYSDSLLHMTPQERANQDASYAWIKHQMQLVREGKREPGIPSTLKGDVTIGDVHVHTQATDAEGIAKELPGALDSEVRKNMSVNNSNSGLF